MFNQFLFFFYTHVPHELFPSTKNMLREDKIKMTFEGVRISGDPLVFQSCPMVINTLRIVY